MEYSEIAEILSDFIYSESTYDENSALCIDNYIDEIENNPDVIIAALKNYKEQYINNNNKCPICYSNMIITDGYDNEVLEYNGFPTRQTNCVKQCENCGKVLEDF